MDVFLSQSERFQGHIIEVTAEEPETLEQFLDDLARQKKLESVVLLGVEKSRYVQTLNGASLWAMPSHKGAEMLIAAKEFVASNAVDVVVMYEILLKADVACDPGGQDWLIGQLRKLRAHIAGSHAIVVLLNPNTSERKFHLTELQFICSHHLELNRYEVFEETKKV